MTTPKRVEKIFQSLKRGNVKLTEGKVKHSVYTLDIQNVKNIDPRVSSEIRSTNGWVISVYYKNKLMAFMAFTSDFVEVQFDYFYPFSNLVGNNVTFADSSR